MVAIKKPSAALLLTVALLLGGCAPPGARALLEGKRLLEQGRPRDALPELRQATTVLKTNAVAWDYLGLACHYAGQTDEAERAYLRALQCDRDLTEAHYNLGCLWLEQNKFEGAKLQLTACALTRPNWLDAQLKLGTAQLELRDVNGAEKSFREALRLDPQNAEALNGLGLVSLQRARPADAAACFTSALNARPQFAPALLNLAIVSQNYMRDHRLALQKYQEYLALKPTPPDTDAVAVVVRQLDQELNPAAYVATSRPAETNPPPPVQTAALPEASATPARATDAAKTAATAPAKPPPPTKARPASTSPALASARPVSPPEPAPKPAHEPSPVSSALKAPKDTAPLPRVTSPRYAYLSPPKPAKGDHKEAQAAFDEGLQAQSANRLEQASKAYHRAAHLDPAFFQADFNLGFVATEAHDWPAALAAYERALANKPDSADARYNFALVLQRANYLADAVTELQRLLAAHPNETRAHLALANLYAQELRQPAKARPHYERVLELDPSLPQAQKIRDWLDVNGG